MADRMLSLLGLVRKAGRLSFGNDAACKAALSGGCALILFSSDLSPRTVRAVREAAGRKNVKTAALRATMDEIEKAIGKRTGVLAVNDTGFAKKLLALNAED